MTMLMYYFTSPYGWQTPFVSMAETHKLYINLLWMADGTWTHLDL